MRTNYILLLLLVLGSFSCTNFQKVQETELITPWHFKQADSGSWLPAVIPGNVHADLLRNALIPDPYFRDNERKVQWIEKKDWVYKTSFLASEDMMNSRHLELVFKGLDTYAQIVLNKDTILTTDNMFREWIVDITPFITEGENTLEVIFESPVNKIIPVREKLPYNLPTVNDRTEKTCSLTRKAPYHYGWDWGPRLVTSGIWKPILLRKWGHLKINNVQVIQQFTKDQKLVLLVNTEIESDKDITVSLNIDAGYSLYTTSIQNQLNVKEGIHSYQHELYIMEPQLWYPVGYGEQTLYDVKVSVSKKTNIIDEEKLKIGLRKVELVRNRDSIGESFYFKINDIPIFAKGANIIPLDNMLDRVTKTTYEELVSNALAANMNMLRVWGGGIYEDEYLYQLCNEKGIMIWQDFMFGNEMYWVDSAFYHSVKEEAVYNIKRLRNNPSIVLWCGDNEGEWMWQRGWNKRFDPNVWEDYKKITYQLLPSLVKELDPTREYWRSSPSSGNDSLEPNDWRYGDCHDWRVHFGPPPFEKYQEWKPRFASEFGHQAFPDLKTIMAFTHDSDRTTAFKDMQFMVSDVLTLHNKQGWGNQKIKEYINYYYPLSDDFHQYVYLSQLTQAEAVRCGVEHYRRNMPHSMGSLFWQLNDCWPVISWSSVDYFGRWKALHYFAAKFYNPVLLSPVVFENKLDIHIVSERVSPVDMVLYISLLDFKGREIRKKLVDITLKPNASKVYFTLGIDSLMSGMKMEEMLVFCKLLENDSLITSNVLFFDKIKNMKLPEVFLKTDLVEKDGVFYINISSETLAKNIYFYTAETEGFFSDNFFDIIPGEKYTVSWTPLKETSLDLFKNDLRYMVLNQIKN